MIIFALKENIMDIYKAKELVLKAGLNLIEKSLIAGTYGNVSCRIDNYKFVVTPSGRSYQTLTPDDIVVVNIADCSYSGNIKPSSESAIHAEVYKTYPDVNFVIHTHQEYASMVSAAAIDFVELDEVNPYLGLKVTLAEYALPGTDELKNNVMRALSESGSKAVIMKNHGALCIGKDYDEAFSVASELEEICHDLIIKQYFKLSRKTVFDINAMISFSLSLNHDIIDSSILTKNTNTSLPQEAEIYNAVYKEYRELQHSLFMNTPEIRALCCYGIELKPVLDDFAQIAGTGAKIVEFDPEEVVAALKNSFVVFIRKIGALCFGRTEKEAATVSMITKKACKAYIGASLFGKVRFIDPAECIVMRHNYLNSYSKQDASNK